MNSKHEALDLPTLAGMLTFICADVARDDWVKLLMGVKSEFGDTGKEVAREWSATASNYSLNGFNSTWKSIRAGGAVTVASLVLEAINNGYKFAPISKSEKRRLKKEHSVRAKQRKLEATQEQVRREERYKQAEKRALDMWINMEWASPLHPYYFKKGISEDVKCLPRNDVGINGTALVLPVMHFDEGFKPNDYYLSRLDADQFDDIAFDKRLKISSLQFIEQDGSKLFLKGGRLKGGFYPVRFDGYIHDIVICEGYATAVTLAVRYAPMHEVVCAFNAGNLKNVALAFNKQFPTANIIIASDNDRATELKTGVNIGIKKAIEACKAVDGDLWIPEFKEDEEGSDWNDLYQLHKLKQSVAEEMKGAGHEKN